MADGRGEADREAGRWWPGALAVLVFTALMMALALGLKRDPAEVPSALIGKPAPVTDLPPVDGFGPGFTAEDFKGKVTLVNVFASWCASCLDEHPLLMTVATSGEARVFGIAYKDDPGDSASWLRRHGNPYAATAADVSGRSGIDWGIRGVPETFVVGSDGNVVHRHVGPVTREDWRRTVAPLIAELP